MKPKPLLVAQAGLGQGASAQLLGTGPLNTNSHFWYRLTNTDKTVDQLARTEHAILLRNALIDTSKGTDLPIPEHLKARGDPGSYIVQSRGKLTDAFRSQLKAAGATIISYVPNNAYLVRASQAVIQQISASANPQAVIPWDSYHKIDPKLLANAVEQKPLPDNTHLNVLVFPGERDAAAAAFEPMKIGIVSEDRSPFGTQLLVRIPGDALVPLAQLPMVQAIEPYYPRRRANDLSRARVRVTTNTLASTPQYMGLDGTGVRVNVNDTGVDSNHPDLAGRVTADSPNTLIDYVGHGTHVAGTIASSGQNGPNGQNAKGSVAGANFRGMAPNAQIFALPINAVFGQTPDSYLQETAAATNAFISNNSWGEGSDYNMAAASWDAAVRDALPGVTGPQPLLAVFSAGNSGGGDSDGRNGNPDSIASPGSAKNVIAVGAIENFRRISNNVVVRGVTNRAFLGLTDSSNQVADFSSRGNVGIGTEGDFGRFKPDVVAPGTFVVSTRSSQWTDPQPTTTYDVNTIKNQFVRTNATNLYSLFVPPEAIQLQIRVLTNGASLYPMPSLLIYASAGAPPTTAADFRGAVIGGSNPDTVAFPVTADNWYYSIVNTNRQGVSFDVQTTLVITNDQGTYFDELKKLNDDLRPWYRYESGTSMSAPVVSGLLALMQQFFESAGRTNSPALMKALLINGARSVNNQYDLQVRNSINFQGWGLPNITNSLPETLDTQGNSITNSGGLTFWDQDPTNALATGESHTWKVTLNSTTARRLPLRFTLVWTDPPGNPAVGVKLVNDLDLIVTNLDNGQVFVGNDIPAGTLFTSGNMYTNSTGTNAVLVTDFVNNVENVFLQGSFQAPLSTNYSVTVVARRVNVNAVTTRPDGIVQDFALVIASSSPTLANAFSIQDLNLSIEPAPVVQTLTNGVPLFHRRPGANSPYLVSTNGMTNQWNFFVFTNSITNSLGRPIAARPATNVAFHTFLPPNLSRPRTNDADIDLFVSTDPAITNLDIAAIQGSLRAVKREGTETIIITNAQDKPVYYVGVKSEDQQSSDYSLFAIATDTPFSQRDQNGNLIIPFFVVPQLIPDGNPEKPEAALLFGFVQDDDVVQNIVFTNVVTHDNGGDLLGNLSFGRNYAVLNNHRSFQGTAGFIYDDSDSGEILQSTPVDGPGSLRNFVGEKAAGAWQLTMIDNALQHTGSVDYTVMRIEPRKDDLLNGVGIVRKILPNRWFYTVVDVPADATKLEVCVTPDVGPVEVYLRRGAFPDRSTYDTFALISPPGDCVSITRYDSPPLSAGRYFIGIFNPNFTPVTARIKANIERTFGPGLQFQYQTTATTALLDDAVTNSTIFVDRHATIAEVNVGVRIDHPRDADLVLHLVSPQGTRILLAEDRGGPLTGNYGATTPLVTNVFPASTNGISAPLTNILNLTQNSGTLIIDYDFQTIPDDMRIYYDGELIYDTGLISGVGEFSLDFGPGFSTNLFIVMNEGTGAAGTAWDYTATVVTGGNIYFTFTENTNKAKVPIKFATPPFTTNPNATNPASITTISSFETVPAVTYNPGFAFDGWKVLSTNSVDVLRDPVLALNSTQFLAAAAGTVSRGIPTTPGRDYRLRFGKTDQCMVSLWHGQSNTLDALGLNKGIASAGLRYGPGEVGTGFVFPAGNNADVSFPPSPSLNVGVRQGMTVDCWIKPASVAAQQPLVEWNDGRGFMQVHFWISVGSSGTLYANLVDVFAGSHQIISAPNLVNTTTFQHVAVTYDRSSGISRLYYNGNIVATTNFGVFTPATTAAMYFAVRTSGVSPGTRYFGAMDEVGLYGCALAPSEIKAIYDAGTRGKCGTSGCGPTGRFVLGDTTNSFSAGAAWSAQSIDFTATTNSTLFQIIGGGPSSVRVDEFQLLAKADDPTLYYLPEEPLAPLRGEDAYGDWKLEVWDTRTGAIATNSLLGWQLKFVFVNTNLPAILLTNGQCYSGVLSGDQTLYFIVNVPTLAAHATNHLSSSDGSVLRFNSNGLPAGVLFNQSFTIVSNTAAINEFAVVGTNGTRLLDQNRVAVGPLSSQPVIPLNRYYLSLGNTDTNSLTNGFTLCVDFDRLDPSLFTLITLTNQIPYTNTVLSTNLLDYYQYDTGTNPVQLIFEVLNPSDWVELVVKRGLPLPNLNSYDGIGSSLDPAKPPPFEATNNIQLVFTDPTSATLAGRWYLGVADLTNNPVSYAIKVTEIDGIIPIILTNQVPQTNNVGTSNVDYYVYTVSSNAYRVDFEVLNPSSNVDLYIGTTRFPPPGEFATPPSRLYASENPGTTPEFISVLIDSNPPLVPGEWIMAVTNKSGATVGYEMRVTEYLVPAIIPLTNEVEFSNTVSAAITNRIDLYSFDISSNVVEAIFELYNLSGDANLYAAQTVLAALKEVNGISNVQPGTTPETIRLFTNGSRVDLPPGVWYLAVTNATAPPGQPVSYTIRATEIFASNIIRLTNAAPYSNYLYQVSSTNRGIDYYVFTVSSNAYQATFETLGANGNVDLFVSQGLPLPDPNSLLASRNSGTTDERIDVRTNGLPVPLTPGDWFIAVYNQDPNPVNYTVRAFELVPPPIIRLTNASPFTNVVLAPNGTTNLGVDYYVFSVSTNAIEAHFETFSTNGNVDLYIKPGLPLPSDTNFAYASATPASGNESIVVRTNALTPGDWYIAVYNHDVNPVGYVIRAFELLPPPIAPLTNTLAFDTVLVAPNGTTNLGVDYYLFTVDTNAVEAHFETFSTNGNVDLYIKPGLPLPSDTAFAYTSTNLFPTNEYIAVTTSSAPVPLTPGDWYLAVYTRETNDVPYSVRVIEVFATNIITLTNAIQYNASGTAWPVPGIDYYRFTVLNTSVRAQFEVQSPSEDVNLIVKKDLPLPTMANADYQSTNSGTNDELITVFNNSTPPLTAGDWYIGVVRTSANAVTYTVKATEFTDTGTNLIITGYSVVTNSLCIIWTNALPGAHYFVQGKVSLSDLNWVPVSPTLTATTTSDSYCVPLPTTNQFFRIAQGLAPSSTFAPAGATGSKSSLKLTRASGNATMNWTGSSTQKFRVQWSPTLSPPQWTSFTNEVSSTNGSFTFHDDGTQTGGLGPMRFYRVVPVEPAR